jgi:hypothetical protein
VNHRDAEIAEIVVILDKAWEDKLAEAVEILKSHGMDISNADDDRSVVEGTVDATKLPVLEHLPCVDYVRKVFVYTADYPTGDPRDLDKEDE